jgi:hypothetical protein
LGLDRASFVQAVKAGKFEDRYENALVELLKDQESASASMLPP